MTACPWDEIRGFRSPGELNRFVAWMNEQVEAGNAAELPVERRYMGATFAEKWFRHLASGQTWRLVWPDAPFIGVFEPVEQIIEMQVSSDGGAGRAID